MPPKGYKTRKTCIVEGCPNPPLVYGDGRASLPCCAEHAAQHRGVVTRNGVRLTGAALDMMRRLRDASQTDNPFVVLLTTEYRTARALRKRDWAFIGERDGVLRAKLTGRGADALAFFDMPPCYGRHGNCPSCGTQPRAVNDGETQVFCVECSERFAIAVGTPKRAPVRDGICSKRGCNQSRHRHQSGRVNVYCREHMTAQTARNAAAKLQRIQNGAPIPICPRCNKRPVQIYEKSMRSICAECERLDRLEKAMVRLRER